LAVIFLFGVLIALHINIKNLKIAKRQKALGTRLKYISPSPSPRISPMLNPMEISDVIPNYLDFYEETKDTNLS